MGNEARINLGKKELADLLTCGRLFISFLILFLTFRHGSMALPLVLLSVLTGWITDIFDGPLARADKRGKKTWIGENDFLVDTIFSLSLFIYLAKSNLISKSLILFLILVFLSYLLLRSYFLIMLFMAIVYGSTILIALLSFSFIGILMILYSLFAMIFDWKRFKLQVFQFIRGFEKFFYDLLNLWKS